jgi:hypothetical protein
MEKPSEVSITCSINIWTGNELKNLLVCGLLVLMLIQSYTAIATIQLSGDSARAILAIMTNKKGSYPPHQGLTISYLTLSLFSPEFHIFSAQLN